MCCAGGSSQPPGSNDELVSRYALPHQTSTPGGLLNCRWHLKVSVWWKDSTAMSGHPCPKDGFPLHHLILEEHLVTEDRVLDEGAEGHVFNCTNCPITCHAYYFPPRLTEAWVNLLTSPHNLHRRCEEFKRDNPERGDPTPEKAINVLEALSAYIRDGLKSGEQPKHIPVANRRFLCRFCATQLATRGCRSGYSWRQCRPQSCCYCALSAWTRSSLAPALLGLD